MGVPPCRSVSYQNCVGALPPQVKYCGGACPPCPPPVPPPMHVDIHLVTYVSTVSTCRSVLFQTLILGCAYMANEAHNASGNHGTSWFIGIL